MAFTVQYWLNYTNQRTKLERKSEQAMNNGRVLSFNFDEECMVVSAHIQASMRDKSYKVRVSLSNM